MASKARAFQQACRTRGQAIMSRPEKSQFSYSTCAPVAPFASTRRLSFSCSQPLVPCQRTASPVTCAGSSHRHIRHASTSSSNPPRRAITVTSDDGRYNWSELSTSEKAARGTQQTFNFVIVAAGLVGTAFASQMTISYLLYQELLAPDSSTVQFNAAVSRIKSSPECRALLGPSSQITAYGEPTSNKWARARPLAHSTETDRFGTTHFRMHFNVSGPDGTGVVTVHMTKPRDGDRLEYQLLSLTIKGHETVYLENKEAERSVKGRVGKMFGVQWR